MFQTINQKITIPTSFLAIFTATATDLFLQGDVHRLHGTPGPVKDSDLDGPVNTMYQSLMGYLMGF